MLAHLHNRRILHRDLKNMNVLVDTETGRLVIGDFGLAREATTPQRPYTHDVVTLPYKAPELLLGAEMYGAAVDVWSFGCKLFEMATGRVLFRGDSEFGVLLKIFQKLGTPNDEERARRCARCGADGLALCPGCS